MAVHPIEFGVVTCDRGVREFQVVREGTGGIRILVVARLDANAGLEARLRDSVSLRLAELGVIGPRVAVERREELARSAGGKLQMVVALPRGDLEDPLHLGVQRLRQGRR